MADRSVRVILSVVSAGFSAGMAKAAADTKSFTSTLEEHKAAVDQLSTAAMAGGAALAAGVGLSVKAYADFDQAMSKVAATGDDAKASMDGLRAAALQAGADTKFSATEAAAGVENLLKAGVSAQDVLGGGLTGALSLAAAGEMDVADAAEVAATAMTQFGLSGTDVGHIADLLAAGAGKAQGEVSDMAMALKQSGLIASQFGLSIDETVGGLTAFASAGMVGSDAGTSFKTMLIALANPTEKSSSLMQSLGINAYDAGGKFIGLEGLAGQLQSRLGGLTDAQRQQALAQIFGTDAMRAASVLYDQGAPGIAKWTSAVNDQGYAAKSAGEKMNNLKGDIEQLSGSWETALIGMGASADGPLRGVVQGLTGVVNALGDLPPFAQTAVLGFAGVTGASLLAVGAFLKLSTTIGSLSTAWSAFAAATPRLAAGISTVGKNALGASVALIAMGAAVGAIQGSVTSALPSVEDIGVKLGRIGQGTEGLQSLDSNFAGLEGRAGSLAEAMDFMHNRTTASTAGLFAVGDAVDGMASGLLGAKSDVQGVSDAFGRMDKSLSAMDPGEASAAFTQIQQQAAASGVSVDTLAKLFPTYSQKLAETASASGQAKTSTEALKGSLDASAQSTTAAKAASDALKASLDAQTQATRNAADAQLQASGSTIGLESAIAAASKAVAENGRNLDLTTESGRANRSALDGIASASLALQGAQEKAGASTETLNASTQRARESFVAAAIQMGMSKAAAEQLATSYGLVPKDVPTNVSAPGAVAAKGQVDELQTSLAGVSRTWQATIDSVFHRAGLDAAWAALRGIDGKTVTTYVQTVGTALYGLIGGKKASGGYVRGAGTTTSDSILTLLSDKEFVIKASSVESIGLDRLWYMNNHGRLPAFRDGGQVHYSSAVPRFAGGGQVTASSSGTSSSAAGFAQAVRSALSGAELRLTGAVDTIGDAVAGRILLAYEGAV